MSVAQFRFYEELNDFLLSTRRKRAFAYDCAKGASVKNAIESLGVPHTEVELVLVNGQSVDWSYALHEGDYVSVYPKFERFDVASLVKVCPQPMRTLRFIADAHLGGLARLLRMLGFDTLYRNDYRDEVIRAIAEAEQRIILTRDRELLKCRNVTHGCFVHALRPRDQLRELVERLHLTSAAAPLTRCLHCNVPLLAIAKEAVQDRLPARVKQTQERFWWCEECDQVYWEGSHAKQMRELLAPYA